jgi:hypothetical protein
MTEEVLSSAPSTGHYEPEVSQASEMTVEEKLAIESMIITPTPGARTFAPLNIPLYRRRQTLTILVWFLMPWTCLYISFLLLRSRNWYVVGAFIAYLTWMVFFQKYSRQGGMKQQWLRRLEWWKWFAGRRRRRRRDFLFVDTVVSRLFRLLSDSFAQNM